MKKNVNVTDRRDLRVQMDEADLKAINLYLVREASHRKVDQLLGIDLDYARGTLIFDLCDLKTLVGGNVCLVVMPKNVGSLTRCLRVISCQCDGEMQSAF